MHRDTDATISRAESQKSSLGGIEYRMMVVRAWGHRAEKGAGEAQMQVRG